MTRKELALRLGLFMLLVFTSVIATETQRSVFLKPFGVHTWRQSDSAAQFRNFHQNKASLWKPQLMNQTGRDGVAVAEFPITYYVAAQLAGLFGFSEAWCRGFHLFLFVSAAFCFYLISLRFIKNPFLALVPSALLLNTPLAYFYANNFIPNLPAISLVIIGWYFYFRYLMDQKASGLWWMLAFMTVGAMIKASEAIHLLAAFMALLHASYWRKMKLPPGGNWKIWVGTAFSFLLIFAWVTYAKVTNTEYGNHMSLLDILPIWNMSELDRNYTWGVIKKYWSPLFGSPLQWIALGVASLGLLWPANWKSNLFLPTVLLGLGSFAYGVLWYQAFMVHDYYLLPFVVLPAFIFLLFLAALDGIKWPSAVLKWGVYALFICLAGYAVYYNGNLQQVRTDIEASEINPEFYTLEESLRALGVDRKDKIISIPDPSPNISLYMCNNPGWTDALNGGLNNVRPYIAMGAKYLVAGDTTIRSRPGVLPYLTDSIGQHGKFVIYRLHALPDDE